MTKKELLTRIEELENLVNRLETRIAVLEQRPYIEVVTPKVVQPTKVTWYKYDSSGVVTSDTQRFGVYSEPVSQTILDHTNESTSGEQSMKNVYPNSEIK